MTLPPDPIQAMPTYDLAKAAFEAQPSIRVLFDNGAGNSSNPGWPYPAFEQSFAAFPIPGTTARSWYLAPGGALADAPAAGARADAFTWDADARPLTDFTGDTGAGDSGLWTATPPYQWSQDPARHAVAYVTEPLSADTTMVGAGRVDLWVRSSAPNVDLQVTISEVRPDGKETFVQNGWVRTIARALDEAKSTELEPVLSLREEDFAPMPSDQFVPVTVPLYYEGHAYRAGSRIRVRVSAPNGDQPIWSFSETEPAGTAEVEIGYGDGMPSRLVLPRGARRRRAGSASAVPGPARRAVSRLRAVRKRHLRPRRLRAPERRVSDQRPARARLQRVLRVISQPFSRSTTVGSLVQSTRAILRPPDGGNFRRERQTGHLERKRPAEGDGRESDRLPKRRPGRRPAHGLVNRRAQEDRPHRLHG